MKRLATTLSLVIGMLLFGFGLASGVSAANGVTEQCPGAYSTKIDKSSGEASGTGYSFSYSGSTLTYDVAAGTTLGICLKSATTVDVFTITGPASGTVSTKTGQGISHVSYFVVTVAPTTTTTSSSAPTTTTTSTSPTETETETTSTSTSPTETETETTSTSTTPTTTDTETPSTSTSTPPTDTEAETTRSPPTQEKTTPNGPATARTSTDQRERDQ